MAKAQYYMAKCLFCKGILFFIIVR